MLLRRAFAGLIRKRVEFRHRIKGFSHIYTDLSSSELNVTEFKLFGKSEVDSAKKLVAVGGVDSDNYGKLLFKQTGKNLLCGKDIVAAYNKYSPGCFTESEDGTYATFNKANATSKRINDPTIFKFNPTDLYTFFARLTYPTSKNSSRPTFFNFYYNTSSILNTTCKTTGTEGTAIRFTPGNRTYVGFGLNRSAEDGIIAHYDTFGLLYGVGTNISYYEEYKERRGEIALKEPLRGIGPVCDVLDFLECKVDRKIASKTVLSPSEVSITEDGLYRVPLEVRAVDFDEVICNRLPMKSREELQATAGINIEEGGGGAIFRLSEAAASSTELEEYLASVGSISFDYVRAEPQTESYSKSHLHASSLFSADYGAVQFLTEAVPKKLYVEYVDSEE